MYPNVPSSVATGLHLLLGYVTVQTAHCALSKQYGGTINVKLGTLYQQNENPDLVSAAGKTMSYCGQQRLAIRVPLVRLYQVNVAKTEDFSGALLKRAVVSLFVSCPDCRLRQLYTYPCH